VLVNLIENAGHAAGKGGWVEIGGRAGDGRVTLEIADSGPGVPVELRDRVFEPFFTTKPPGTGTGLGLSTVYGIVKQNGGYITIESDLRKGTVVTIFWPRSDATAKPSAAVTAMPHAFAGTETILLVEDEKGLRNLMRKTLQAYGYTVLEAVDCSDALRLASQAGLRIDLLVSDVVMPGLNGPDLSQRIVASQPGIRILYVSGFPNSWPIQPGDEQPKVQFLAKPFTPRALATRVRDCLEMARRA